MQFFFICHSINPQTGIGRLVNSIIDSVKLSVQELKVSIATSDDLFSFNNKLRFLFNLRKIFAEARKAEMIHVFDAYPYGFLAVIIGRLVHCPVILTAVGTGSVKGLKRFPTSFLMRYAFRKSQKTIAISHFIKNEILSVFPDLKIEVINPGVDVSFYQTPKNLALNPFLDKKYILSVGSLKKRKGYDVSIRIFKTLLEKQPDLYYVIVAKTDDTNQYYCEIKKMIEDFGISERVLFVSDLTEEMLKSIYCGARLFILMSQNDNQDVEGFGLVFLEAALSGVPVIGCRGTGAEDAIDDSVNGYLVDINNEEDIIEKANKILTEESLWNDFSRGSILYAEKMNYKNIIPKYVQIYTQF